MEDLQKCLSHAAFIDLQWMRRTDEKQLAYIQELKDGTSQLNEKNQQMQRQLEKEDNEILQLQNIKNNLVKSKEKENKAMRVDSINVGSLTETVALAESRYSDMLLERRLALQNSAMAQPAIQLRNQYDAAELKLKKYRQAREHIKLANRKREEYEWLQERASIVELAKLMKELREANVIVRQMEKEKQQLVRVTQEARERERRPQLGPLQVSVTPDRPTRPSPPSLTPLYDFFSPEDDQSQLSTLDTSENKMEPPPAKVPRAAAPRLQNCSLKQICIGLVDTLTDGVTNVSKQIKVINEVTVRKENLESILKVTEICKLQKVSNMGGDILAAVGLRETPARDNTCAEVVNVPDVACSLMSPPTQFRDTQQQPEEAMEVVEYNITEIHDEPSKNDCTQLSSLQMDDTSENVPGDMDSSHGEFTSLSLENVSFTQMKESLLKKFNVTASPEFVYSKKNDNATVTSKFFPKKVAHLEAMETKESTVDSESRPVLQTQAATLTYHHPPAATLTSQHPPPATLTSHHPSAATLTSQHPPAATLISHNPPPATLTSQHPSASTLTSQQPPAATLISHNPPPATLTSQHPTAATLTSHHPSAATLASQHPPAATLTTHHPPPATLTTQHPPPATLASHHPSAETLTSQHPPATTLISHNPPPATLTSHHPPLALTTPGIVNNIPVAELEKAGGAALDDERSVTSPKMAAVADLDDSSYDFTSMLDTPSLLLSPAADEIPNYDMNNQLSSIFGVQKPAFPLLQIATAAAPEQNTESGATGQSNTEFNFFQDNKKRGFFSLFN